VVAQRPRHGDKADKDNLLRDTRMNALATFRSMNSTIFPFDFARVADQYLETVTDIQTKVTSGIFNLNPVLDKIRELKRRGEALNSAIFGQRGEEGDDIRVEPGPHGGFQDPYLDLLYQCGRYEQDPAYTLPAVPALQGARELAGLDPGSDEAGFLRTKIVREANRSTISSTWRSAESGRPCGSSADQRRMGAGEWELGVRVVTTHNSPLTTYGYQYELIGP